MSLPLGDMVGVPVNILDENKDEVTELNELTLFAGGDLADALEQRSIGDVLIIQAQLLGVDFSTLEEHDSGNILSKRFSSGLVLSKISE